ncbi:MAG: hypothetical protein BWY72_00575 [Bacteroidetes bacterium ADurb.Bin416]|nr:MAG: hypothetical protein BWY72_00575 [Bacteroidetes bacterium ADurb.Bin416]
MTPLMINNGMSEPVEKEPLVRIVKAVVDPGRPVVSLMPTAANFPTRVCDKLPEGISSISWPVKAETEPSRFSRLTAP